MGAGWGQNFIFPMAVEALRKFCKKSKGMAKLIWRSALLLVKIGNRITSIVDTKHENLLLS
jgi:hypothetical protein